MREEASVAELARRYGISRKTAYKWIYRFLGGCDRRYGFAVAAIALAAAERAQA